jgi:hypothetical protein
MGVVIIEDQVIEAILERLAVNVLMHEDGNVVVLVFVPEGKGDNLCAWRYYRLDAFKQGFQDMFLHRFSALFGRAKASATIVKTVMAVANASRASLAITLWPW